MNVRALPTCRKPVGDGANRTRSITSEYNGDWSFCPRDQFLVEMASERNRDARIASRLLAGYEGNAPGEDPSSDGASYKKILLKTPCPGRNLPEDTCCFGLSAVTGLDENSAK